MPDPATVERLRSMVLSATELKDLTDWPEPIIEEWLNFLENFVLLASIIDIEIDQKIEEIPTDFTDGSIPFANSNLLTEDNAGLSYISNVLNATSVKPINLTPSLLVASNANKILESVASLTNWIAGTLNRISVTDDGDGTVTLSLPQDIHTGASPTFAGLTVGTLNGIIKATAGVLSEATGGVDYENPLTFSQGLTRVVNAVTNNLITGLAGSQEIIGGTAASETLLLTSTSNATKGLIALGSLTTGLVYDQVNNRVGVGTATPSEKLTVGDGGKLKINSAGNDKSIELYHDDISKGIIECDNNIEMKYQTGTANTTALFFGNADYGGFDIGNAFQYRVDKVKNQMSWSVDDTIGNHLVLANYSNRGQDFDHILQTNPTLYVHSDVDPDTDNTQWVSLTHDQTNGVFGLGKGAYTFPNGNIGIGTATPAEQIETTGDIRVGGLTASKPVWTDADKTLISKDIAPCDVARAYITPTTQTVTTGTLTSGTVSDVQTWQDGNEVHISEVSGVPGFDIEYTFENVSDFCEILVTFYYVGSGTHDCTIEIYDDTNAVWKEFFSQSGAALSHNTRFSPFPEIANVTNYINSSDEVKMRFYHPVSGNASHDLYIDYVSIIGATL